MNSTLQNIEALINSSDQIEDDVKTSFLNGFGYTRYLAGDTEGAKTTIANSIKAAEQKESAFDQFLELTSLAILCLEVGDQDLAQEITKKAEDRIPALEGEFKSFSKYNLVILLVGTGDLEKAKEIIKAFDTPDQDEDAEGVSWAKQQSLLRLAQGLARNGQIEEALKLASQFENDEESESLELVDLYCLIAESLAVNEEEAQEDSTSK